MLSTPASHVLDLGVGFRPSRKQPVELSDGALAADTVADTPCAFLPVSSARYATSPTKPFISEQLAAAEPRRSGPRSRVRAPSTTTWCMPGSRGGSLTGRGFTVSPLLSRRLLAGLSAGRVEDPGLPSGVLRNRPAARQRRTGPGGGGRCRGRSRAFRRPRRCRGAGGAAGVGRRDAGRRGVEGCVAAAEAAVHHVDDAAGGLVVPSLTESRPAGAWRQGRTERLPPADAERQNLAGTQCLLEKRYPDLVQHDPSAGGLR